MNDNELKKLLYSPLALHITMKEFKMIFCGEKLGQGVHRETFVLKQNPNYVVKIDRSDELSNVLEWKLWDYVKWLKGPLQIVRDSFAECKFLMFKADYSILIQERAELRSRKEYPKQILDIFTDPKITNFGWVGDRFVCFDYEGVFYRALSVGGITARKRNARWSTYK